MTDKQLFNSKEKLMKTIQIFIFSDMVKTNLTPWVNNEEWNHVRDLIVSR